MSISGDPAIEHSRSDTTEPERFSSEPGKGACHPSTGSLALTAPGTSIQVLPAHDFPAVAMVFSAFG